ncbi:hypothetical protein O9K51_00083 [Purpureocillium lavendulum]|uniref:Uncharacterized protein n=1 Tax=Purpureocillium lavendulum TaxID=1247861 RepID=A0AB34G2F3_9HYPO|nr:hypothetical protein O9K51_00083 [Purpureocillium lavendulum]
MRTSSVLLFFITFAVSLGSPRNMKRAIVDDDVAHIVRRDSNPTMQQSSAASSALAAAAHAMATAQPPRPAAGSGSGNINQRPHRRDGGGQY